MTTIAAPVTTHFDAAYMARWAAYRQESLVRSVTRAAEPTIIHLRRIGVRPRHLLALSARELHNPDFQSFFVNQAEIILRREGSSRGRLGLWESEGVLCLEAESGGRTIVLRGARGEMRVPGSVVPPAGFEKPRFATLARGTFLEGRSARILSVIHDQGRDETVFEFATRLRRFSLRDGGAGAG